MTRSDAEGGSTPLDGGVTQRTRGRVVQRAKRSRFARTVTAPLTRQLRLDETAGWPIIGAAIVALLWANLGPEGAYEEFWTTPVHLTLGATALEWTLRDLVDLLLLPFFFLVIGLEIREEMTEGALSRGRDAWAPMLAAAGGMIVPIAAYLVVTWDTPQRGGFGVPVATDIAFALALLTVLGDRVPAALKAFLLAFAAADDVGGVLVIAVFYGHGFSLAWLLTALAVAASTAAILRLHPQNPWTYVGLGSALWAATALSGIHVTIAGVVFGLMVPNTALFSTEEVAEGAGELADELSTARPSTRARSIGRLEELTTRTESPAAKMARVLRPVVGYVVLPLFGLAMAGTAMNLDAWRALPGSPAALGIALGLVVGKPVGVLLFTWIGVRLGIASLPPSLTWRHVTGAAVLASIGFTVALFIAKLAFEPAALEVAKLAILTSSALGGSLGLALLALPSRGASARSAHPEDVSPSAGAKAGPV